MLEHGGLVLSAANRYGIPIEHWLDLSTGINPESWPLPDIPLESWHKLPQYNDGLEQAARKYFGSEHLLTVAGSQSAIQLLPELRSPCRVGCFSPSYAEHRQAWSRCGHDVTCFDQVAVLEKSLDNLDVVVVANPDNPTGRMVTPQQLLSWWDKLKKHQGWLVVDEAFVDTVPELSLSSCTGQFGLIVLRSLGKFFGLSGARVGFILSWTELLEQLAERIGPWAVSGPSRYIAKLALADKQWQEQARIKLKTGSIRLKQLLNDHKLTVSGGTDLFQCSITTQAQKLHDRLASMAILTRLFPEPLSLRFGLPSLESDWQRLSDALETVCTDFHISSSSYDRKVQPEFTMKSG